MSFMQIVDLVADCSILDAADLDSYIDTTFVPYIKQFYGNSRKVDQVESFLKQFVKVVKSSTTITQYEVK